MTHFNELELLYNQYLNLAGEIKDMIGQEEYEDALIRIPDQEKLIKKIFRAQKTVDFTPEQRQKFDVIQEKIRSDEKQILVKLISLKDETGIELRGTNQKIKINNAYSMTAEKASGVLINYTE